jgi:hypothetical protein
MKLEIKTANDIFESITQSKYHYNIQAQTLAEYEYDLNQRYQRVDENIEYLERLLYIIEHDNVFDGIDLIKQRIKVLKSERDD